jgi:ACS family tartrate transporter-like MFS transporter
MEHKDAMAAGIRREDTLNTQQGKAPRTPSAMGVSPETIRRVATRLMPFLLLCYFVSFLDRQNVAFAALQMNKDLALTASEYGFGAGLFFLTYCFFEVPSNLILFRLGATRWIARIMLTWGLCAAGMAFIVGPYSYYAVRLALGAAEAGFFPGVLFFLTLWFPSSYRGRVLGVFMAGVAISGAIGAPLSGYLLSFDGLLGLRGWQWLFLLEGAPAVVLAPICLLYLQDGPANASWLPQGERAALAGTLDAERRERETLGSYSFAQAVRNPRVLFLAFTYFSNVCLLNSILFFLPLILKGFGLSNQQTGLVAAIPSLVALVAVIYWGRHSDRTGERNGHAALALAVGGLALLASAVLIDPTARIVAVTISLAGTIAFTPPFWTIPGSFLSGSASAGGYAAISSLGVIGGFVAPSITGYLKDLTGDFRYGLGAFGVLAVIVAIVFYSFGRKYEESAQVRVRPVASH